MSEVSVIRFVSRISVLQCCLVFPSGTTLKKWCKHMQAVSCYPKNVARTIEEKRYRRRTSNMFHIHYWINDAVLETINKVSYTKNKIEILSILPKKHLRDSCTIGKVYRSWCLGGGGSKKQLLTPEVCIVFRASKNHELTTMFSSLHPISPNEIKLQVLQADFLISPTTFLWPKVVPSWRMMVGSLLSV